MRNRGSMLLSVVDGEFLRSKWPLSGIQLQETAHSRHMSYQPFCRYRNMFTLEVRSTACYTRRMTRVCSYLLLLGMVATVSGAPVLKTRSSLSGERRAQQAQHPWWKALQQAILEIQRNGAGGYSTDDRAKEALVESFRWNERYKRPVFSAATARPSFCSGAVYAAVLSGLLKWEEMNRKRVIAPEAWRALMPQMVADGVGPWGYANANGAGFALLVHRLGAGINFTDWSKAAPSDVMKIWWTDEIGGKERGHLVVLVRKEKDAVQVWSSHLAREGQPGGYGLRTIPRSAIARVLFTRITNPAAFNRAHLLKDEPWLTNQLTQPVSWEECCRRCGIVTSGR